MGSSPVFRRHLAHTVGHVADNGLSALVHRDVFHRNLLLAAGAVSLECFHLRGESPGELVESTFRAVLLENSVHIIETAGKIHSQYVNSGHLRRKHCFNLVLGLHALDNGDHKVNRPFVHVLAMRRRSRKLRQKRPTKIGFRGSQCLHQ